MVIGEYNHILTSTVVETIYLLDSWFNHSHHLRQSYFIFHDASALRKEVAKPCYDNQPPLSLIIIDLPCFVVPISTPLTILIVVSNVSIHGPIPLRGRRG